jgi:hypothetical protein
MAEFVNQEFVRNIVYYIQTDFIKNDKTCSKSCLKINEGIPFDVCKDYCMIKFYVTYFLILFKVYIIYKLTKNIINKGSWFMATVYTVILFLI